MATWAPSLWRGAQPAQARATPQHRVVGKPVLGNANCCLIFSCARMHQSSVLTLWPAYLFHPCDLQSSARQRKGDPSLPRLPGDSHLLHRGLLNCLHGGDSHRVPDEDHHQEAGLQQPAGCAQAHQAHPLAETGNRK